MTIIRYLLIIFWIVLLIRVLSSWFPTPYGGPMRSVMNLVHALTEPVLRPLRNVLPPVRMGMVALDLSPIIIFIVISILLQVLR
jgi:YggT family protein